MPDLAQLAGRTVVIFTHPRRHIVESMHVLKNRKLLDAPNLYLLGVYHEDETENYDGARAYIRENRLSDIGLRSISCPLTAGDLFGKNRCTTKFEELWRHAKGIIFPGGPDIPPALYGEETSLTTVIESRKRVQWELSFLFHLLGGSKDPKFVPFLKANPDFTVLGICMGMQAMNVATGGTLVQDIPSEIYGVDSLEDAIALGPDKIHRNHEAYLKPHPDVWHGVFHPIRFTGAKDLWGKLRLTEGVDGGAGAKKGPPPSVAVMSIHHQALEKLGHGLEAVATSEDGKIIEGIRHTTYPNVLGVQFHPEYHVLWKPTKTAKLSVDAKEKNAFAATLARDQRAMIFHRAFWRLISERVQGSR